MVNSLAAALGFDWDRTTVDSATRHTVPRALWRYRRSLAEFVWDAAVLEGNPLTYPEVLTLVGGITVGGHRIGDAQQVIRLAQAAGRLADLVAEDEFALGRAISDELHELTARDEAAEAGHFRGEGRLLRTPWVDLGADGRYVPPETEAGGANLRDLHTRGVDALLTEVAEPFEQALAYYLFAALQQFYFDGNKRTGRAMMNGHLMAHGIDAISVPAARRSEFGRGMVSFYRTRDATGMFAFLASCHPDREPGAR
ncbi:Fic family protein [Nocardia aurantia]|uniref:Fido domain-containing protein n=1 Tax=Nocardia aurantia TaxID=2585199 RepID=A0A7K0DZ75_9NOCA|nr:Fic family protein [Nocardia aurantia]MQY31113.1 hypothetical protein [Nocardia aurantia]